MVWKAAYRPKLSDPARATMDCNRIAMAGFAAAHG